MGRRGVSNNNANESVKYYADSETGEILNPDEFGRDEDEYDYDEDVDYDDENDEEEDGEDDGQGDDDKSAAIKNLDPSLWEIEVSDVDLGFNANFRGTLESVDEFGTESIRDYPDGEGSGFQAEEYIDFDNYESLTETWNLKNVHRKESEYAADAWMKDFTGCVKPRKRLSRKQKQEQEEQENVGLEAEKEKDIVAINQSRIDSEIDAYFDRIPDDSNNNVNNSNKADVSYIDSDGVKHFKYQDELQDEIFDELQDEPSDELQDELSDELSDELQDELFDELQDEVRTTTDVNAKDISEFNIEVPRQENKMWKRVFEERSAQLTDSYYKKLKTEMAERGVPMDKVGVFASSSLAVKNSTKAYGNSRYWTLNEGNAVLNDKYSASSTTKTVYRAEFVRVLKNRMINEYGTKLYTADITHLLSVLEDEIMFIIAQERSIKFAFGVISGCEVPPSPTMRPHCVPKDTGSPINAGWTYWKRGYPKINWTPTAKDCERYHPLDYFAQEDKKFSSRAYKCRKDFGVAEIPEYEGLSQEEISKKCREADVKNLESLPASKRRFKEAQRQKTLMQNDGEKLLYNALNIQRPYTKNSEGLSGQLLDAVDDFLITKYPLKNDPIRWLQVIRIAKNIRENESIFYSGDELKVHAHPELELYEEKYVDICKRLGLHELPPPPIDMVTGFSSVVSIADYAEKGLQAYADRVAILNAIRKEVGINDDIKLPDKEMVMGRNLDALGKIVDIDLTKLESTKYLHQYNKDWEKAKEKIQAEAESRQERAHANGEALKTYWNEYFEVLHSNRDRMKELVDNQIIEDYQGSEKEDVGLLTTSIYNKIFGKKGNNEENQTEGDGGTVPENSRNYSYTFAGIDFETGEIFESE